MRYCGAVLLCMLIGALSGSLAFAAASSRTDSRYSRTKTKIDFTRDVKPVLDEYCSGCHGEKKKGGLDLRIYTNQSLALRDRPVFEKMFSKLQSHEMPPQNKPQPTLAQSEALTNWLTASFFACDCRHPDPGRVTIRRLNRAEYNTTIRDLLGVDFQPASDFPADDSGYGFDNNGDVLSVSPLLMEKYLTAAEHIMNSVFQKATNDASAGEYSAAYRSLMEPGEVRAPKLVRARQIISGFASRAFRRPVTANEQQRFLELYKSLDAPGEPFDHSIKLILEAVLISPQFLFRGDVQPEPDNVREIHKIDEYALASRLSYFLWSSMPDEELTTLAARRSLRKNLEAQVKRMLNSKKSHALVENFAGQWLQLRNLKLAMPDRKQFPAFNDNLRAAMEKETEMFFESIWLENRSILDLLEADYSFVNESLAKLYGLEGIKGESFRRVSLKGTHRSGLLSQASILTITSNPTRTSPVKRGKWVLENILGAPPPPPPPDVPELKEGKEALTGSLRQRMEQHRSNPNCASCHARMDPIGFGFENFDAIGAWRDKEQEFAIDSSGKLTTGESFNGPGELKTLLLSQKREDFVRCLSEKLLVYALGRGLEYYDKCAVQEISKSVVKGDYKFSALIFAIVKSAPFQMRRGEDPPAQISTVASGGSGK